MAWTNDFLNPDLWVPLARSQTGTRLRLFCLPYAGGGASFYRLWPESFPPEIEICPIQLPGRENRYAEAPYTRLFPLANTLARVLHPFLDLPFAIFGHSLGALTAFELARQLRWLYGRQPVRLFVSACPAPHLPRRQRPIHQLPDAEFEAELVQLNHGMKAFFQNQELIDLFSPLLRADFAVYETYTYTPEAALECPISVFGGIQDARITADELVTWGSQTAASASLRMFPGDHFYIHDQKEAVVEAILQDLDPSPAANRKKMSENSVIQGGVPGSGALEGTEVE